MYEPPLTTLCRYLSLMLNRPSTDPFIADTARALRDGSFALWDLIRSDQGEVTFRWVDGHLVIEAATTKYQGYVARVL